MQNLSVMEPGLLGQATVLSFKRLDPRHLWKNPVMFVTAVGAVLTTCYFVTATADSRAFVGQIAFWLWATVLFANFSESLAEGRGRAQAEALKKTRTGTPWPSARPVRALNRSPPAC